jgi:hypothetical protein
MPSALTRASKPKGVTFEVPWLVSRFELLSFSAWFGGEFWLKRMIHKKSEKFFKAPWDQEEGHTQWPI